MGKRQAKRHQGATIVEHCLILSLIAITSFAAVSYFGRTTVEARLDESSVALASLGGGTDTTTPGGTEGCEPHMARAGVCYLPPCQYESRGGVVIRNQFNCDPGSAGATQLTIGSNFLFVSSSSGENP